MSKIIGIDLGTTNSVVAVMEGGGACCYYQRGGWQNDAFGCGFRQRRQPSGRQVAKRQAVTILENTIYSIKRFMGRRFNEVSEEKKQVPYKVQGTGTGGDVRIGAGAKNGARRKSQP